MPDCANSIPILQAPENLARIAVKLPLLDEGLLALALDVALDQETPLPADCCVNVECVRADLLYHTITTLTLASLVDGASLERRRAVAIPFGRLGGFTAELIAIR